jgi:hypothetical protein
MRFEVQRYAAMRCDVQCTSISFTSQQFEYYFIVKLMLKLSLMLVLLLMLRAEVVLAVMLSQLRAAQPSESQCST